MVCGDLILDLTNSKFRPRSILKITSFSSSPSTCILIFVTKPSTSKCFFLHFFCYSLQTIDKSYIPSQNPKFKEMFIFDLSRKPLNIYSMYSWHLGSASGKMANGAQVLCAVGVTISVSVFFSISAGTCPSWKFPIQLEHHPLQFLVIASFLV